MSQKSNGQLSIDQVVFYRPLKKIRTLLCKPISDAQIWDLSSICKFNAVPLQVILEGSCDTTRQQSPTHC